MEMVSTITTLISNVVTFAGGLLPPVYDDLSVYRIKLHHIGLAAALLAGHKRRA